MIGGIVRLQRLDDAGQVGADGEVGVRGPPVGDGVGDGQVLGQRHLGTAGPEGELELVPDELSVQPLEQPDRDGLPGDHPDPAVQLPVELGVLQRVAFRDRALEVLRELAQLGGLVVGDPFRGLDRAQCLQGHPALGDRDGLFGGDDPDARAAVGDPLDEPFSGEVKQRGPQRLPRHPERPGQLLLDKPLARREVPAEDGLPQRGKGVRPRCLPGPRPARRSCCHAPTLRTRAADCQQSPARIVDNPLRKAARLGASRRRRAPGDGAGLRKPRACARRPAPAHDHEDSAAYSMPDLT